MITKDRGHKDLVNVLKHHPSDIDFAKIVSTVFKHIIELSEDDRLPDKLVESDITEGIYQVVKQSPDIDIETKLLFLQILKFIIKSTGVLYTISVDKGKEIMTLILESDRHSNLKLDQNTLELLEEISLHKNQVYPNDIKSVLKICRRNHENHGVI